MDSLDEIERLFTEAVQEAGERTRTAETGEVAQGEGEVIYSFAGEHAKVADYKTFAEARQMIYDGEDPETVRQKTGWFQGYDGKWRFEIDDSQMEVDITGRFSNDPEIPEYLDLMNKVYFEGTGTDADEKRLRELDLKYKDKSIVPNTLGEIIRHERLFEAYPQLKDVAVVFVDSTKENGSYHSGTKEITLSKRLKMNKKKLKKTLGHEIQHAIQDIERFAGGSSPKQWAEQIAKVEDGDGRTPYQLYESTAGEIEARDVASRADMTEEQRKNTRPDIDREDVVFAKGSTVSNSFAGWTADGTEVYVTSPDVMKLSLPKRIQKFRSDFLQKFKGKTAKFERNGHTYYARFVETHTGIGKFAFEGQSKFSQSDKLGYKAKIRLIADGDIFDIVEDGKYLKSSPEQGKTTAAHANAKYWDYFWKEIFVDGKGYDVVINIRNDFASGNLADKEQFVYSMTFKENKKVVPPITTPASKKQVSVKLEASTNDSITQPEESVNTFDEKSSDNIYSLGDAENGDVKGNEVEVEPTDRELLAMALEGAVQSEQEYAIVKEYREQASMMEVWCRGQKIPMPAFASGCCDSVSFRQRGRRTNPERPDAPEGSSDPTE